MNVNELINFLNRVLCWMPDSNPVKYEVWEMIQRLRGNPIGEKVDARKEDSPGSGEVRPVSD